MTYYSYNADSSEAISVHQLRPIILRSDSPIELIGAEAIESSATTSRVTREWSHGIFKVTLDGGGET